MRPVDPAVEREITQFLYREARLLDEGPLGKWLDLLTDDIRYFMPVVERVQGSDGSRRKTDEGLAFDLFDDDKPSLVMRVERVQTGFAYSELPRSITQHMISNIEVDATDTADEYSVRSKFLVFQMRPGRYEGHDSTFVGDRIDRIRKTATGWRIARREVRLAHEVLPRAVSVLF